MSTQMIPIYILGRRYDVPEELTIMKALEWAGYQLVRGCGCRGGFCGACGTVYRVPGDYRLRVGLACQTPIEPNMYLTELPFFPANKARYNLSATDGTDPVRQLLGVYPEVTRCMGCNSCTKICPQKLRPIDYMAAALRGDFAMAAELSFDCIMCGLCAARCPAELVPYNIAIYVRRFYAQKFRPVPESLRVRVSEIREGKYDEELARIAAMSEQELRKLYAERDFEKL